MIRKKSYGRGIAAVKCLLAGVFMLACAAAVFAGATPAGRESMPFFRAFYSARAVSMGSSFVSLASGTSAIFLNPAGLGDFQGLEVSLHHVNDATGAARELLSLGVDSGQYGGFAFAVNYVNDGSIETTDDTGRFTGLQNADALGAAAGWGRQWLPGLFAGIAAKFMRQSMNPGVYDFFAVDTGIIWEPSPGFRAGLAISNLGFVTGGSGMVPGLNAGMSYLLKMENKNSVCFTASADVRMTGDSALKVGFESVSSGIFSVRAGYSANLTDQLVAGVTGFSAGAGIKFQDIEFDYAFCLRGELGVDHRISFIYNVNRPAPLNAR